MDDTTKILTAVFILFKRNQSISVALTALIFPIMLLKSATIVASMNPYAIAMHCGLGLAGLLYETWVIFLFRNE